ncbi:MAG TPA: nucleoside kinase [Anaerolineales bacterium]|jgi:uridine kinase
MVEIEFVEKSQDVEIHLPDGRTLKGPRGASVEAFLKKIEVDAVAPIVGAVINGDLHELTHPINMESRVTPVTMADADGARIYRRSLTFLLEAAFSNLFPSESIYIDHSVSSGGYYCHAMGRGAFKETDLERLEAEMQRLVELNLPLKRREAAIDDAIAYFRSCGFEDKVHLMKYRRKPYVTLYSLGEHVDYHHGYMVPSTGYLKWFEIVPSNGGFTLRFPRRHSPTKLLPMEDYPKLLKAFRQYGDWLERLGIESVGALDDAIQAGRSREIILVSEALQEQHIASIARQIAEKREQARIILISGPTSSGKTTFSRRLAVQLLALGLSPYALELDNYFVDRELNPKDENGEFDFETIDALDLPKLGSQLQALIGGEEVQLPHYNFKEGRQEVGDLAKLRPGQLIILEGIHGLNPRLIPATLEEHSFKIYASALTQLNLDRHNRVSTTDTRLIRRILRDARERGYSAAQTIGRWESVRRGEKRHIFPFQENADVMFNSALAYELSVLRPLIEPLLRQVPHGTPENIETKRLLAFLEWFLPVDTEMIPDNSILREFVGGSILKDFKVWGS